MVEHVIYGPRGGVKTRKVYQSLVELVNALHEDRKQRKPRRVGAQLTERQRTRLEQAKAATGIKYSQIVRAGLAALGIK